MQNIALALSGGGFRAAAYSLGCLSFLSKVTYGNNSLLDNVRFISSASGGSITNLLYTSRLYSGRDTNIRDTLSFISDAIDGEKLIGRSIEILKDNTLWKARPAKSRNLINAFSLAYDELFERDTLGVLNSFEKSPHVLEVCVNATEFTNGISFRFQNQHPELPNGMIGNYYIHFKDDHVHVADGLSLGDILASSSCFPTGFEPLIFPKDYANDRVSLSDLENAVSIHANEYKLGASRQDIMIDEEFDANNEFGIMDGGIADNQGIEAFKLACERRKRNGKPMFDLFLSCDVSSHYMDSYSLPKENRTWYNGISPLKIGWFLIVLAGTVPFSIVYFVRFPSSPWVLLWTLIGLVSFSVYSLWSLLIYRSRIKAERNKSTWGIIFHSYFRTFLTLPISTLWQMIQSRLKSTSILAGDVYLKVIRSMHYDSLYADPGSRDILVRNVIYRLSKVKEKDRLKEGPLLAPSQTIIDTAEKARTVATTLWFDRNDRLEGSKELLIATGEFTTCYSLLKHILKTEQASDGRLDVETTQLKEQLIWHWQAFKSSNCFAGIWAKISREADAQLKVSRSEKKLASWDDSMRP